MDEVLVPMKRAIPLLFGILLVATPLAGCIGGSGGTTSGGPAENVTNDSNITADEVKNQTEDSPIKVKQNQQFDPESTVHPHNYWNGREKVTVLEETISINWADRATQQPTKSTTPKFIFDIPQKTENGQNVPNYVFPGTGKMEMTLAWGGSATDDPRLCVANNGAGDTSNFCTIWGQDVATSGETVTIDQNSTDSDNRDMIGPDTWDEPHSLKSDWRFQVWLCGPPRGFGSQCAPDTGVSSLTLTVTIFRGPNDLPIDPPHFAFYGNRDKLQILPETTQTRPAVQKQALNNYKEQTGQDADPLWYLNGQILQAGDYDGHEVVSWETETMVVKVGWTATSGSGVEDLIFMYKHAGNEWSDEWEDPPEADDCDLANNCKQYVIPVTGVMADSPYASTTDWEFGVFSNHDPETPTPFIEITWSIDTYKAPPDQVEA